MPVVQPPPVSRFAFAKPHEIPSGRVALTGTPLDAKPCLIGHFTLRPGRTVAEAFMAIGPNRNPPPPGGIRHHMLRGATDDTFLFLDILDSYAAVANCLKRLEAHPQALADLAGIVEPGGEAWIGPLCCVPSHMVPRSVIVDVIRHGAVNVTMAPRPSAFHKPTVPADVTPSTNGAAAVVVTAAVDSSNDDAWIPPSADDAVDFPPVESIFFSRYWRHCAINWFTRRPFEPVCSAEVHAYEVEPVWFEMGTSVAGRTPPGVKSPDAESVPAGSHAGTTPSPPPPGVPMASVTRRGYGDAKQQFTYQHRPHDPPVYRVAEDHGTLITRCSTEEEGILAAAAAFDQTGFRNLQMRAAGTASGPLPSNHADPGVAIAAVASGSEGEVGDERQRRRRGRKPPPMCAQVVDSAGKRRRCRVDPRRVPHLDVGDVLVMAMVTLSQQNQPLHSPLSATMGLGRVTSVSRWSRRKAAIGQQLAEDQHAQQLRAERRATIADVSAAAAAVGGGVPLPWAPSAAHAANAAIGGCRVGVVAGIYTSPHLPCHLVAPAPTGPAKTPAASVVPSVFAAVNFDLAAVAAAPLAAAQDTSFDGTPMAVPVTVLQRAVAATCGVAPESVFRIAAA